MLERNLGIDSELCLSVRHMMVPVKTNACRIMRFSTMSSLGSLVF